MTHTNHVIASKRLGKDVNVRVYGTKGYPVIAFPTQDQMADEWEANGMTDVFGPYVEAGRVQLFTVDSNDLESWSSDSEDFAARIARQEDYYDFVCDELLPYVHEANGSMYRPELVGCSLGATQATICALRRPDLFQGAIALSGMYHTSYFFGDWGNDVSYANDVNAFLPNTPADHPYLELYRHRTFAFAIGQAADEQFGVSDLHFLQETFQRLGIDGWFDFWGPESNHDWYWWKQQMAKFLPEAVRELEGVAKGEPELAKAPAKPQRAAKAEKKDAPETHKAAAKATKAATTKKAAKEPERTEATTKKAAEPVAKAAKAQATKAEAAKAQPARTVARPERRSVTARMYAETTAATTKDHKAKAETTAKPAGQAKASAHEGKAAATATVAKAKAQGTKTQAPKSAKSSSAKGAKKATSRPQAKRTSTRRQTAKKSAK